MSVNIWSNSLSSREVTESGLSIVARFPTTGKEMLQLETEEKFWKPEYTWEFKD